MEADAWAAAGLENPNGKRVVLHSSASSPTYGAEIQICLFSTRVLNAKETCPR